MADGHEILNRCYHHLAMIDYALHARYDWTEYGKYYERILTSIDEIKNFHEFSDDLKNITCVLENKMIHDEPLEETIEQLYQQMVKSDA